MRWKMGCSDDANAIHSVTPVKLGSNALLWTAGWLLHLPRPVVMLMNEMNGPLLGILYRHSNLSVVLMLCSLASCLLLSGCIYSGLKRCGYQPLKQVFFWVFGVAMFLLPVFSALGAMSWLKGKQLSGTSSPPPKAAVSLIAAAVFLLIVGWMFWVNGVTSFQGYVLRSVLKEKVAGAEQTLQKAFDAEQRGDAKTAHQKLALSRKLLQEVASYRYPCCREKIEKLEEDLIALEQILVAGQGKKLKP